MIRLSLVDKDCPVRNVFARQYVHLLSSLKSFRLYSDHLNSILTLFRELINQSSASNGESPDLKYIFEQSVVLFETVLFPPKMKNLRFAATTASSSTDLSSFESTTFQSDENDELDYNNQKDNYLIGFARDLCQLCFQFCLDHSNHSAFEHSLNFFTHLLNASTVNHVQIVEKLTERNNAQTTTPERFYANYARPLIQKSIEQHCSLDQIVELTIRILDTFESSDDVVERVLADLIQMESSRRFYFLLTSIVCRYETSPSFHTWLQAHGVLEQLLNMTASVSKSSEMNDLNFPVSTEEFQLLSSLLCSSKPTQYLTDVQQEQIVYLACRLLEEQTPSVNESDSNRDLLLSIDHVAKHLFQNIDQTYARQSTKNLVQLYFRHDLNNIIRKNIDSSQHLRSIWSIALQQSKSSEATLVEDLIESLLTYIAAQFDNDAFVDTIISIGSEHQPFSATLAKKLFQRAKLSKDQIGQSWIYGMLHGWLLPEQSVEIKVSQQVINDYERMIDIHFLCFLTLRQYELNCYLWSNDNLVRDLILNYYFFLSRCVDVKHLYSVFERLLNLAAFRLEFRLLEKSCQKNREEFYSELVCYHFYCQMKERYLHLNQRDDLIQYTMILDNNDEFNLHLFLASIFRESQLKLLLPHLIEQCQDERRSSLALAALNQCLIRMNRFSMILDETSLEQILEILIKLSASSKEVMELIQLWNTLLNHGTVINSLKQQHWDNVLCLISNLFQNLTNAEKQIDQQFTLRTEFLFIHASNLLTTLGKFLTNDDKPADAESPNKQLFEEWLLLYSKDIYQGLLPLYVALPSESTVNLLILHARVFFF